jgi:hypothetical protein
MKFKAHENTSLKQKELDHLNHTTQGTSGYRQKLKHDTLPKLDLTEKKIRELRVVILFSDLNMTLSLRLILLQARFPSY